MHTHEHTRKAPLHAVLWAVAGAALLGGCSREEYRADADEEVYGIIDEKWQGDFGIKANFMLADAGPNDVNAVDLIPASGVIGLAEAVNIATQCNREYQSQKESLYLSALDLTLTRHRYAWQWLGTVESTYVNAGGIEETPSNANVSSDREFLIGDGIQMGTGLALDWARFLTGDPATSLGSVLTGTLAAPLLGAGAGKSARENLTQAERNVLYRIRSFNRYRKTFVVSIVDEYYRVLQQRNSVAIQEASYNRLVESTKQLRMEVEVGQRPAYDLGEAEQSLLGAEQSLVGARQSYEQRLDNFKIRLALPTDAEVTLDPNELTALEEAGIRQPDYPAQEAIETAMAKRLDLANIRDGLDDAERKLILAAEGLGPQLNLVGDAHTESTPDTRVARLRFHEGVYALGVEGDLPFDRKAERNAYREALISVESQQRSYDAEVDQIKLNVREAYRNLTETAESYRIQQLGLELAKKRVEVEKLSLQYGRGTVRLLLDSEDALVQAQNDVLGALVDHMIAKLSFFRDVGILQVRPDGMWEQVTP